MERISHSAETVGEQCEISRTRIKKAVRGYLLVLCLLQIVYQAIRTPLGEKPFASWRMAEKKNGRQLPESFACHLKVSDIINTLDSE